MEWNRIQNRIQQKTQQQKIIECIEMTQQKCTDK